MKQRLEAAQEGVSTEDGSSSVTSGLDEDQAAQADMMMRRLVQASLLGHALVGVGCSGACTYWDAWVMLLLVPEAVVHAHVQMHASCSCLE